MPWLNVNQTQLWRLRAVPMPLLALEVKRGAIPGQPGANRPDGEVSSPLLVVAAVSADVILLLIGALWLTRRRRPASEEPGSD